MEQEAKNYELAYLLSPSIPEEEILMCATNVSTLIEEQHGSIKHLQEPKKQKLAYAIQKERNTYFGWTTFRLTPEAIAPLNKKLAAQPNILRYLIVEEQIHLRAPIFRMPVATKSGNQKMPIPRETEKSEEKLDLEALDKKLEEILGK